MIRLSMRYPSSAMFTNVNVEIGLPGGLMGAEPPWKTLWALHPCMGDGNIFFEDLNISTLIDKYNFAFIAPSLGNNYFVNTKCQKQADFLTEIFDTLHEILPLGRERAENSLIGISMGGFGAARWGLASDYFAKVAVISGEFDPELPEDERLFKNRAQKALFRALRHIILDIMREADDKMRREANIRALMAGHQGQWPQILAWCGEEDYLSLNQTLHLEKLCQEYGCPCQIAFMPGGHDAQFWRAAIDAAVAALMDGPCI